MTLRFKIVFATIIVIFIFGSAATASVFLYTKNFLANNKKTELKNKVTENSQELKQNFEISINIVDTIAKQSFIRDYLKGDRLLQEEKALEGLSRYNIGGNYSALYLLDSSGTAVVSTDQKFVGQNYSFRDYFQEAIRTDQPVIEHALGVTSKNVGYYFSRAIWDERGNVLGVVVMKMEPASMEKIFERINTSSSGKIMLTDSSGVIIYSSVAGRLYKTLGKIEQSLIDQLKEERKYEGIEITPLQYDVVQNLISNDREPKIAEFFDAEDGEQELLILKKIGEFPFYLVLEEDQDEYLSSASTVSYILGLFVLGAVLGSAGILLILIRHFLKPLGLFQSTLASVSRGDFGVKIPLEKMDGELKELAIAFNDMSLRVKRTNTDIDKKVKEQTREIREKSQKISDQQNMTLDILKDVQAEKNKSQLLANDLEKFKLAVENATDHIVITDPDGRVLYANKAVERITGFNINEIRDKKAGAKENWGGLMQKDFYKKLWKTIKEEKKPFSGELNNMRKSGEKYSVLVNISPILDEKGNVEFFVGIERDISEQKMAEEQIRKILNNLQEKSQGLTTEKIKAEALLANIGDGIIATDQDGQITVLNDSAEKLLGWKRDELINKPVTEMLTLFDKNLKEVPLVRRPMVVALSTGEKVSTPLGETYFYKRKDGLVFPVGITVTPFVLNGKIIGTVTVLRDITIEKNIDRAKTEFVSLASHQLRTPLTAINWYSEMLLSNDVGKLNKDQKEYMKTVWKSSQRMTELVNSLLNVSRLELGTFIIEPSPVEMVAVAEDVLKELAVKISEKKMKVVKKYSAKKINLSADPKLLRIVFQNLLSNAVKYTGNKGEVILKLEKQKDKFLIEVTDNGYGIPQKDQASIFGKLFRADNAKQKEAEGTGLGLYIVRTIIGNAGGKIWFDSIENKGTSFFVRLPLTGMLKKEGDKPLS